jgi:L-alanine-DL-glutamate epimerase-like enolase superfamily enzyme
MKRREFLAAAGSIAITPLLAWAEKISLDIKITRITSFNLPSRRQKFIGKNSRLDDHGITSSDRMVRLYTNVGVDGIGNCRASQETLSGLLGQNPFSFYVPADKKMTGPLGVGTMPLWDLIGKLMDKPVYQLLGGPGAKQVPVYDGSIYFADLLPENQEKKLDRFKEEIDMGMAAEHRTFKVKVGRGAKWMPKEEGYRRDVEVLQTIRKHCGPDIKIGIDANDGYDLPQTKKLLAELPDYNFAFLEEMFPEDIEKYRDLKQFINEHKWKTLIADGETQGNLEAYKPYIQSKTIDVFQGDMNRFGIEGILTEASWCQAAGLQIAPHNWGSLIGFYMQLHIGRAIPNLYLAEQDPLSTPILIADGYTIKDGLASVPDSPGFGLKLDEEKFAKEVKINFDLKI